MQVEEDVVAELDAVNVGMRLQAPACGKGGRDVRERPERHRSSLLLPHYFVQNMLKAKTK